MVYGKNKSLFIVCYNNDNFGDDLLKLYYLNESNNDSLFLKINLYKKVFFLNKKKIFLSLFKLILSDDICFIGGIFQDYSSKRSLLFYLIILWISIVFNKKIYILSSTFEIKSKILQNFFIKILKNATNKNLIKIVEVRDSNSYEIIKNLSCNKKLIKDPYDKNERKYKEAIKYNRLIKYNESIRYNRSIKYAFINDIKKNQRFNKKIFDFFKINFSNLSGILILSINKSYQNNKNKILLENILVEAKIKNLNFIFIISDPKDFDIVLKFMKNKKLTYHIAKISQKSINSLIEFIKTFDLKIIYTERLHSLLILEKSVDFIIINGNKTENYVKTWFQ